jgi:hypothetical protein
VRSTPLPSQQSDSNPPKEQITKVAYSLVTGGMSYLRPQRFRPRYGGEFFGHYITNQLVGRTTVPTFEAFPGFLGKNVMVLRRVDPGIENHRVPIGRRMGRQERLCHLQRIEGEVSERRQLTAGHSHQPVIRPDDMLAGLLRRRQLPFAQNRSNTGKRRQAILR